MRFKTISDIMKALDCNSKLYTFRYEPSVPVTCILYTAFPGIKEVRGSSNEEIVIQVNQWYDKLSNLEKIVYHIEIIPDKV